MRDHRHVVRTAWADSLSLILIDYFIIELPHVVLKHENVLGFYRNLPSHATFRYNLVCRARTVLPLGFLSFFFETKNSTNGLIFVQYLKVFVNQYDAFLQVIKQLFSAMLLIKLLLQFLKILLQNVVVFFMKV